MARRSSETAIFVQATEDEIDDSMSRKSVRLAKEMECSEAPVDATDTEMLCQVIFELVTSLLLVLVVSDGDTSEFLFCRGCILCPDSGYRQRVCPPRVSVHPAADC